MIQIERNKDRSWSASSTGAMGRVAVCEDVDYTKCIAGLRAMLAEQERERYYEKNLTELREMAAEIRSKCNG